MDRRFVGRKVICLCRGKMLEYEKCYRNKRYNISNSNKNDFRVCLPATRIQSLLLKNAIEVYFNSPGFIFHYMFKAWYIHKNREK